MRRWELPVVGAMVLAFQVVAGALALALHWDFAQALGLDNAYFLQRVWSAGSDTARTLLATESGQGLVRGRHVEPILALAVPWIRAWPSTAGLLLFQTTLLGTTGVGAWGLARAETKDAVVAALLAGATLALPALWALGVKDVRTLSWCVPFAVGGLALLRSDRWALGGVAIAAAVLCREEVAWLLLGFVPWLAWRTRDWKGPAVLGGVSVAWLVTLRLWVGRVSDFARPDELLRAPPEGRPVQVAQALWDTLGPSLAALLLDPLALLPALANGGVAALLDGVWSPGGVHLFSGALIAVVVAQVSGCRWVASKWAPGGRVLASVLLAVALGSTAHRYQDRWSEVGQVLTGELRPGSRVDRPWQLIARIPDGAPLLTEATFVAQVSPRALLYATDDWRDPEAQRQVAQAVGWALLREQSEWHPLLEELGWQRYAVAPGAVLLRLESPPLAELNPLPPGEGVSRPAQGDPGCPAGMVFVPGHSGSLGESDPQVLEQYPGFVVVQRDATVPAVCVDRLPFPGRLAADWPSDGLSEVQLPALQDALAPHGRRLCTLGELLLATAGPQNQRTPPVNGRCETDDQNPTRTLGGWARCVTPTGLQDVGVRGSWVTVDPGWGVSGAYAVLGGTPRTDTFYAPTVFGVHEHGQDPGAYLDDGLRLCADPGARSVQDEAAWQRALQAFEADPRYATWLQGG
jgi:hypothetical protein